MGYVAENILEPVVGCLRNCTVHHHSQPLNHNTTYWPLPCGSVPINTTATCCIGGQCLVSNIVILLWYFCLSSLDKEDNICHLYWGKFSCVWNGVDVLIVDRLARFDTLLAQSGIEVYAWMKLKTINYIRTVIQKIKIENHSPYSHHFRIYLVWVFSLAIIFSPDLKENWNRIRKKVTWSV